MEKIKALVVDDSALMRKLVTALLEEDPEIEVVGAACDAFVARDMIKELNPDVLTLDIEMPKMDGLTFLENLMRLRPMPVVMLSTLTAKGADATLRALDLGAVDFIAKPKVDVSQSILDCADEITSKVKAAAAMRTPHIKRMLTTPDAPIIKPVDIKIDARHASSLIAIGSSTGGTEAIKEVLCRTSANNPGVVITQHIPPMFSTSFAQRMNCVSELTVCEAVDGQEIHPGHAYIAPGGSHLEIFARKGNFLCRVFDGERVNRHKPSVDVLFDSVAKHLGRKALGIILTGMGKDGAQGLKRMQEAGATTIAQDEETSVVWGMPGAAVEIDAADEILPLEKIGPRINELGEAKKKH